MFISLSRLMENLQQRMILICGNSTNIGVFLLGHVIILHNVHTGQGKNPLISQASVSSLRQNI